MATMERRDDSETLARATLALTPAEVAARVRPYAAKMTLPAMPDITFSVGEAGIYLSRGYWRVPIHPSRDPEIIYPFIELLGDLQDKLRDCEGFRVTIETGDPRTEG